MFGLFKYKLTYQYLILQIYCILNTIKKIRADSFEFMALIITLLLYLFIYLMVVIAIAFGFNIYFSFEKIKKKERKENKYFRIFTEILKRIKH